MWILTKVEKHRRDDEEDMEDPTAEVSQPKFLKILFW